MELPNWKSPRAVAAEIRDYRHQRFEHYMSLVDDGNMVLSLACLALQEEMAYVQLEESGAEPRG